MSNRLKGNFLKNQFPELVNNENIKANRARSGRNVSTAGIHKRVSDDLYRVRYYIHVYFVCLSDRESVIYIYYRVVTFRLFCTRACKIIFHGKTKSMPSVF